MLNGFRIALVEDDEFMGSSLVQRMELEGAEVVWLKHMQRAIGALRTPARPIDAVICDIRLPDGTGEELYNTLCRTTTPPPFLFVTGHGGVEQAVRLMRSGAADYVTKPFEMGVFLERLSMLVAPQPEQEFPPILGMSPAARRVEDQAREAAKGDAPVLIRGGSGTGKGLLARRIHEMSDRRAAPFLSVNLAREPDAKTVLFAEGGLWSRLGEGTLFLNALGHLSAVGQLRLSEALDAGCNGRVIAACGDELLRTLDDGGFEADLYYRLNMTEILVPPYAERPEDAVWLMHRLFEAIDKAEVGRIEGISQLADDAVRLHEWRDGGREIRFRLRRGLENAAGPLLQPADLFPEKAGADLDFMSLAQAREQAERAQIVRALEKTEGRIGAAAKLLKVSRTTLWEKMQKLGIGDADG